MQVIAFYNTDRIIPTTSKLEKLASGLISGEGPVWQRNTQTLFFTDFSAHRIYQWNESDGLKVYRENSGRAVGLTFDAQGRLLACESKTRAITRTEEDGKITLLAQEYQGKRLNSPNDIVAKSDSLIYFTDPYSTMLKNTRELEFNGVYKFDGATGSVDLLVDDFQWPNGIAFSPDESQLYINDTLLQHIRVFDVQSDGTLANGKVFAEMDNRYGEGVADGMKVDIEGNVYLTGPGGIWIISSEGNPIGIIKLPEKALNLAWGGINGNILFITAVTSLYRIQLAVPGILV